MSGARLSRRKLLLGAFLRPEPAGAPPAICPPAVRSPANCPPAVRSPANCPESLPDGAGVARIRPTACIAFRGTPCVACLESCPIPGAVGFDRGRPRIESGLCNGCGECITVCPAPLPAIERVNRT